MTAVDRLYSEFQTLISLLGNEPSSLIVADDTFRKAILIAAASYFEFKLSEFVRSFALEASGSSDLIASLVQQKVIERQYHSWFSWDAANANKFYKLFGEGFLSFMKEKHKGVDWLDPAVRAFMEVGRSRNLLVHENFAVFSLEKTAAEIYSSYQTALPFVEAIPSFLRECNSPTGPAGM